MIELLAAGIIGGIVASVITIAGTAIIVTAGKPEPTPEEKARALYRAANDR